MAKRMGTTPPQRRRRYLSSRGGASACVPLLVEQACASKAAVCKCGQGGPSAVGGGGCSK